MRVVPRAPVAVFRIANHGHPIARGWEIPIAGDVVLAFAVFGLLGSAIPRVATIVVLGIAALQDVGASVIAGIHCGSGLDPVGCAFVCFGFAVLVTLRDANVKNPWVYLPLMVELWIGAHRAGIHPASAGLLIGVMAPIQTWPVSRWAKGVLRKPYHWFVYAALVTYALANAGVGISGPDWGHDSIRALVGITFTSAIAKPFGVIALIWLAVRCEVAELPLGLRWRHIWVIGLGTGMGLSTALSLAQQVFAQGATQQVASVGVLASACTSSILTLLFGYALLATRRDPQLRVASRRFEGDAVRLSGAE